MRSVSRAISALVSGDDAARHYDFAAERIQHALLNIQMPSVADLEFGVCAEPARLVGGDYIDVFCRGHHVLFGLGDASGKSLGAAINALMLRYLVRGLVQVLGHEPIDGVISHANKVVAEDLDGTDYFITLLLGTIDARSGRLKVANAGHEPALVLRDGALEVETMAAHGIVLGVDANTRYAVEETTLQPGDRVLLYTDGLTEATNVRGELFTVGRLRESFLANRELDAQELAKKLFNMVKTYADDKMRDDATILVIGRSG